ncbi:MAG: hypothetical protein U0441_35415 [Polyangiaceae bacterium]
MGSESDIKLIDNKVGIMGDLVGVNTDNPAHPLHVIGYVHADGQSAGFSFQDRQDTTASGTKRWVWYSKDGIASLWSAETDTNVLNATADGNIGFGVNKPAGRLHVEGNTLMNGDVTAAGNVLIGSVTPVLGPNHRVRVSGDVHSHGGDAGFSFQDRGAGGASVQHRWVWYSQDGIARLWYQSEERKIEADVFSIGVEGNAVNLRLFNPTTGGTDSRVAMRHDAGDSLQINPVRGEKGYGNVIIYGGSSGVEIQGHALFIEGEVRPSGDAKAVAIGAQSLTLQDPGQKTKEYKYALHHGKDDKLVLNAGGNYHGGIRIEGTVVTPGPIVLEGKNGEPTATLSTVPGSHRTVMLDCDAILVRRQPLGSSASPTPTPAVPPHVVAPAIPAIPGPGSPPGPIPTPHLPGTAGQGPKIDPNSLGGASPGQVSSVSSQPLPDINSSWMDLLQEINDLRKEVASLKVQLANKVDKASTASPH